MLDTQIERMPSLGMRWRAALIWLLLILGVPGWGASKALYRDNPGRVLSVDDLSGTTEWSYDDLGNPLVQSRAFDSYAAQDVEYSYYPDGSREEMSATIGGTAYTWHYSYDERGFCEQMTSPAGTVNFMPPPAPRVEALLAGWP